MANIEKVSISKLSKSIGVSRTSIYNICESLNIDAQNISEKDAETIREYYAEGDRLKKENSKKAKTNIKTKKKEVLSLEEVATLKERLLKAKEQYNFNQFLISTYMEEIEAFQNQNGTLTIPCNNGSLSMIPQVKYVDTYEKLNISLNKTIDDLESKLDLIEGADNVNPFE